MKILPFSAWYPKLEKILSPDTFFGTVKERYTEYHEEGYFKKMPTQAFYIYQIATATTNYTGLLATLPTEEYIKGNIIKHEQTIAQKEEKTVKLVLEKGANVKPILLTYPAVSSIDTLLQHWIAKHPPLFSTYLEAERTHHKIWSIEDNSLIIELQELFEASVPSTYIADGHHRTATMGILQAQNGELTRKGDYSRLLVALFASNQLRISEFNRIIRVSTPISPAEFHKAIQKYCNIELLTNPQKPSHKHSFITIIGQDWWLCKWKEDILEEYRTTKIPLDVQILNEKILKNILQIKEVRTDERIKYISGDKGMTGLQSALHKNPNSIGFYLYPIPIKDFISLTNQHTLLPPKSTFFEPRMKNGLVVRRLV